MKDITDNDYLLRACLLRDVLQSDKVHEDAFHLEVNGSIGVIFVELLTPWPLEEPEIEDFSSAESAIAHAFASSRLAISPGHPALKTATYLDNIATAIWIEPDVFEQLLGELRAMPRNEYLRMSKLHGILPKALRDLLPRAQLSERERSMLCLR